MRNKRPLEVRSFAPYLASISRLVLPIFIHRLSSVKAQGATQVHQLVTRLIPLLLLALPIAEIAVLVLVGSEIGFFATISLILLSILAGTYILRTQGLSELGRVRNSFKNGTLKGTRSVVADMLHSLLKAVAGILLIIPGFLTDAVAILLLLPPVRALIGLWLLKSMTIVTATAGTERRYPGQDGDIIEGEFEEAQPEARPGGSLPPQEDRNP